MWTELWRCLRGLYKSPGFAVLSIGMLSLAVAVAGNSTILSIVDLTILEPLAVKDQERLFVAWESDPGRERPHIEVSFPNFEVWRTTTESFENMAVYGSVPNRMTVFGGDTPYAPAVSIVGTTFFDTLGVEPHLGRTFRAEDDRVGFSNVVVLNHSFWARFFGSDPSVIGQELLLDGNLNTNGAESFTVIGVAAPGFQFPHGVDLWFPAQHSLQNIYRNLPFFDQNRSAFGVFWVAARLKDSVSVEEASAELDILVRRLADQNEMPQVSRHVVVTPFVDQFYGRNTRRSLLIIQGAALLFLLVSCVNAAGLQLVRSVTQRDATVVRLALGATRFQIVRRLLMEVTIILAIATGLGLAGCAGLLYIVRHQVSFLPHLDRVGVDWSTIAIVVCASCGAVFLTSLPALLHSLRLEAKPRASRSDVGGIASRRTDQLIISTQTAIACALLVVAGLVTLSYDGLRSLDLGYTPSGVFTFKVVAPESKYPGIENKKRVYRELLQRLEAIPSVRFVGMGYLRPLEFGPVGMDAGFRLDGQSGEQASHNPNLNWMAATPKYFRAMGLDLLEGRDFAWEDDMVRPPVVVIGESLAQRLWPGESALGKRILTGGARRDEETQEILWQSVIGVVQDGRYRELETPRYDLYVPMMQSEFETNNVVVRADDDELSLLSQIHSVISSVDADMPATGFAPLSDIVDQAFEQRFLTALAFDVFAGVAVLFAAVGAFGVMSFTVVSRMRELGLRLALGAVPRDVVSLVMGRGGRAVILGVTVGLGVSAALSGFLGSLLFDLDPLHWPTFVGAAACVSAFAMLACFLPARRASQVDPLISLRHE